MFYINVTLLASAIISQAYITYAITRSYLICNNLLPTVQYNAQDGSPHMMRNTVRWYTLFYALFWNILKVLANKTAKFCP